MVETIWCITCDADQTKGKDGTLGGGVAVEVGDRVSISLKTVLVAEFSESPIFGSDTIPQMIARKDGDPLRANGEIAISATVIDAVRQPAVDPDKAEGRIVFYSDDTIEGQTLNQTNLTIYGPVEFMGGPLYVRFSIYEIDADSEQMKKLLSAVANAGKIAYAPASPVLSVLEGIGASVAQGGNESDRVLQYTAVFDGGSGAGDVRHLQLVTGDYVLVRSEARKVAPPWNDLYLVPVAQILRYKNAVGDHPAGSAFAEQSYVVFTINKGLPGGPFAFEQTLTSVEERLKASQDSVITAALVDSISSELVRTGNYEVAASAVDRFSSKGLTRRARQEAGFEALKILAKSRCDAASAVTADQARALTPSREDRIISRLRSATLAEPETPAPATDPTANLWPSLIDAFLWPGPPVPTPCVPNDARLQSQAEALAKGFKDPPAR